MTRTDSKLSITKSSFAIAIFALGLLAGCASTHPSAPASAELHKTNTLVLRILDPRQETNSTTRDFVNVLGRTSPEAAVMVGGEAATLFATGIFVRDQVPLEMGENRLVVVATGGDGQKIERVLTINRVAEPTPPPEPKEQRLEIDRSRRRAWPKRHPLVGRHPRTQFPRHARSERRLPPRRRRLAADGRGD